METIPLFLLTRVSRKAIRPLLLVSFLNEILGLVGLGVSWKVETESRLMLTKLLSTKRFQILGVTVVVAKTESLTTTIHKLATTE